jgi:O-antigen/teichoic acid export membrane protein
MRSRIRIPKAALHGALNTASTLTGMVSGLVVMPYLIMTMGASEYGVWVLIGSLVGYFGVFDLGLAAAVGRFVARSRAQNDMASVNRVLSTGLALLLAVCAIAALATFGFAELLPTLFHLEASQLHDAKASMLVIGFSVALMFPLSVFSGLLWGYERFDLQNAVDIPFLIGRAVLTLTLVHKDSPLFTLACIIGLVNVAGALVKIGICFLVEPALRLSPRHVSRAQVSDLCSFGGWMSLIAWSRNLIPQIAPTFIGHAMSSAAVTTYSVAKQLVSYTNSFAITATQVVAPRAVAYHATDEADAQRNLFLVGGRFASCLAFFFLGGIAILGFQFIHFWQHGLQDAAYPLVVVLMVGEFFPTCQWITYSIVLGSGKQRSLGLIAIMEACLTTAAAMLVFVKPDLGAIALGMAVSAFLTRGIIQCVVGCRLVKVGIMEYLLRCVGPSAIVAVPAVAILGIIVRYMAPSSLISVLAYGVLFTLIYWLLAIPAIAGRAFATATLRTILQRVGLR